MIDPEVIFPGQSVNAAVQQRSIRHAFAIERLKAGQVKHILSFLRREVTQRIEGEISRIKLTGGSLKRAALLKQKLREIDSIIDTGYAGARQLSAGGLKELASFEATWQKNMLNEQLPFAVNLRSPSPNLLNMLVTKGLIQGKTLENHWKTASKSYKAAVRKEVKVGLTAGTPLKGIIAGVRKKTGLASQHAQTVVRTSVGEVMNKSALKTFKENDDVLKGWVYSAVLDARTTEICIDLDGQEFKLDEQADAPPQHPRCRSRANPVVKSLKEMGFDIPGLSTKQRASLDGKVPKKVQYLDWLKKEPRAVQNQVLGKGKAELFRKGKIKQGDLTDRRNRPLSLKQHLSRLPSKQAKTFEQFAAISPPGVTPEIKSLLDKLTDELDPKKKKSIRAKLRRLGHKGGAKGAKGGTVVPDKPKPPKITPKPDTPPKLDQNPTPTPLKPTKPVDPIPRRKGKFTETFKHNDAALDDPSSFTGLNDIVVPKSRKEGIAELKKLWPSTQFNALSGAKVPTYQYESIYRNLKWQSKFVPKAMRKKLKSIQFANDRDSVFASIRHQGTASGRLVINAGSKESKRLTEGVLRRAFKSGEFVGRNYDDLIAHEMGHFWDLLGFNGRSKAKIWCEMNYRVAPIRGVSKYAFANQNEMFAELYGAVMTKQPTAWSSTMRNFAEVLAQDLKAANLPLPTHFNGVL